MPDIEFALQEYIAIKATYDEHQQNKPIGVGYDAGDTHYWTMVFHEYSTSLRKAELALKALLDDQLHYYSLQHSQPDWNKNEACRLLKERVGYRFSASIKELFLYIGTSVVCIPEKYKKVVINDFAHALEQWANVDIDEIRDAVKNIGSSIDERCHHCNELMPEFEGTGHPVCSDCN